MIAQLYRLWPDMSLLARLWLPHALMAIVQGLTLGTLIPILDRLLRAQPDIDGAMPWLLAAGAGVAVYLLLSIIGGPLALNAYGEMAVRIRHRIMAHLTTLPPGWFTPTRRGELVHTATQVVGHLVMIPFAVVGSMINNLVLAVTISTIIAVVDWPLGLLLFAFIPAMLFPLMRLRRITAEVSIDMEIAGKESVRRVIEFAQAQPVLRATGQGRTGPPHMREAFADHARRTIRAQNRMLPWDIGGNLIIGAAFVAPLALLTGQALSGAVGVHEAVALLVLVVRYAEPLAALSGQIAGVGAQDYLADQVEEVLNQRGLPAKADPVREVGSPSIVFDNVTFSYSDHTALSEVSFSCPPGSTTALVGPSGAGKTTVIRLAARFFDVDTGHVKIAGVDVRDYDHDALLDKIAVVFQDVYLFDATIAENLRLARPDATDADLEAVARAARLDEVVERLPQGWQTTVGEGGVRLSGGERQRVSIARALLKKAPIVLIDEAASALDPESERAVADAIADLAEDRERTVIIVAHRPTTLAAADQVVALRAGRIVEAGPTAELRETGGAYAQLYDQYERARGWRMAAKT